MTGLIGRALRVAAGAVLFIAAGRGAAVAAGVEIAALGHLYVGGRDVALHDLPKRDRFAAAGRPALEADPNGDFIAGATYLGFVTLAHPRHAMPIVMMPGGGLSGAVFETTPDGRPGWQWNFLRAGYSTYVADLDQTGRSGWSRYPEINPLEPAFRTKAFLWEVFRIGPAGSYAAPGGPVAFEGSQFPAAQFPSFVRQAQPRFPISPDDEARAFDDIAAAVCPCILLTHSASGRAGLVLAQSHPALIKAVISVEPSAVPNAVRAGPLPPHLFLWGDFLAAPGTDKSWQEEYDAASRYREQLRAQGARADWISLPARGIRGNTHMLMADRNSDFIARMIVRWLSNRGL
jgi:pimeloyl-ACP methyl ester carboxylesterase